ncbi:MAG: hypothetical protein KF725_00770 [Cyclobacteriaceae bacterium]|nr:hypothetical protein [Cyclobacteriaceae bacterium]UYN87009.1 MAG: hypothetical protein KIT51_01635 [Cyclobacteriaceae bacterium]
MIDIRFGLLLPWTFRLLAACAMILGLSAWQTNPWVTVVIGVVGFFALVAHEGTEINPATKTYREYTSFFFFKTGRFKSYTEIELIFINRAMESQQMYTAHTTHSSTFENMVYNAYLKFSNGEKIHLQKIKNKEKLMAVLKPLSEAVQVEVTDNT